MAVNDRGFVEVAMCCEVCGCQYICAPDDPHDSCECPKCLENNIIAAQKLDDLLDSNVL